MGLEGKRVAIVDSGDRSSPFFKFLQLLLSDKKVKLTALFKQYPIPEITTLAAHDIALIHLPQNEHHQTPFFTLFEALKEKSFPFIVLIAITTDNSSSVRVQLKEKGYVVIDKHSNINRWIEKMEEMLK